MKYQVRHVTDVRYGTPVRLARFNVRLEPAIWPNQRLFEYSLEVTPAPASIIRTAGPYVVHSTRLLLNEPIASLKIDSSFCVDVTPQPLDLDEPSPTLAQIRQAARANRDLSAFAPSPYLFASSIVGICSEIGAWASPHLDASASIVAAGRALMQAIYSQFVYDSDATKTETPPIMAFRQKRGVCQDFAHIMISALRTHGIPAAYVSGYLRTMPPPGRDRLVGCDAMHAWVCIWCGDRLGWIGFDPTNNLVAQADHITIAMGRDYADVAPLDGVFHGNAGQNMRVMVDVLPIEG